ncbi:hypothetical protein [Zhongshania sp.]|jgi:hypothetical protein|nr:hypothetical protein [Zhongshania sp.]
MTENKKGNSGGNERLLKENGRGLPTTGTKTPMPPVKPPKSTGTSK